MKEAGSPHGPIRPPRLARWVLRVTLPRRDRRFLLGDLDEELQEIREREGRLKAWVWYWHQALGSIPSSVRERWETRGARLAHGRWKGPESTNGLANGPTSSSTNGLEAGGMGRGETLIREVPYAARGLRRSPGFTLAVVATLGLGIGANAGLYDLVDRLFLQPPAFISQPETVHRIYFTRRSNDHLSNE